MAEQSKLRNENSTSAFERVQLARHPERPHTLDFVERLFEGFTEVHGDRRYADDPAIICGFARFHGMPVLVVGHQKGRDTRQRQFRNFGMPKPEGYRKAIRAMKLAEKFERPIFSFIDTPGAYPGIDAEERGQAEAIAYNLREMTKLTVPVIVTVIGEGGSGGALAIGVGDQRPFSGRIRGRQRAPPRNCDSLPRTCSTKELWTR
jgi:acetyl-CoA carboxylase carboxyl transferase subunit alpha